MLVYTRDYIRKALAGTPDVLELLLSGLPLEHPLWDNRPEPDRWTLREITAHLAAWDEIFAERIELTSTLTEPEFGHVDVDEQATRLQFAISDPRHNMLVFRERRAALMEFLDSLEEDHWERLCRRHFGTMSIAEQIALILAHDNYHLQQVSQWLRIGISMR